MGHFIAYIATPLGRMTTAASVISKYFSFAFIFAASRILPHDIFPPIINSQHYFHFWRDSSLWIAIDQTLLTTVREANRWDASPFAGV